MGVRVRDKFMAGKIAPYYIKTVVVILLATAALKMYGSTMPSTSNYLDKDDEVMGILSHRQLLLVAALLEIGVVGLLLRPHLAVRQALQCVAWVGCVFAAYRLARWMVHANAPCGCLGVLVSPSAVFISKCALGWVLGGSISLLLMLRRGQASVLKRAIPGAVEN